MAENTIFPGKQTNQDMQPENSIQQQPVVQKENTASFLQQAPPVQNDTMQDDGRQSRLGLFIKIFAGVLFIGLVAFFAVRFIMPFVSKEKNETITISYWGLWEEPNVVQAIIADFQRENPNIKVLYSKQDIKQYRERLTTRIQNGSGPDVFRFHNTWLPQVKNVLLPLPNDTLSKEDFQKWYYPVVQNDLVENGAIYGVPLGIDTLALFTNTESLQAATVAVPTTWDDFSKAARLLTVKDENGKIKTAGAALGTFDNITHAPDILSLLFIQNGADIRNLQQTSKDASDALEFYTSFAKGDAVVWDDTLDPSLTAFANGSLAMYFGYSWDIFVINVMNPKLNFSVSPVPHLPRRDITIASYWSQGVSAKSTYQKEALLFLRFLSKKETSQKLFTEASKIRLFGEPYARIDLADSLKSNPMVYPFVSQAKYAASSFFASDTYDNGLNEQMNGYLGNAVRSVLANTSPQSAIDVLSQGISQVLKQYGEQ